MNVKGESIISTRELYQLNINFSEWLSEGSIVDIDKKDGTTINNATILGFIKEGDNYSLSFKTNKQSFQMYIKDLVSLRLVDKKKDQVIQIPLNADENIFMERTLTGINFDFCDYIYEGTEIEITTTANKVYRGILSHIIEMKSFVLLLEDKNTQQFDIKKVKAISVVEKRKVKMV